MSSMSINYDIFVWIWAEEALDGLLQLTNEKEKRKKQVTEKKSIAVKQIAVTECVRFFLCLVSAMSKRIHFSSSFVIFTHSNVREKKKSKKNSYS